MSVSRRGYLLDGDQHPQHTTELPRQGLSEDDVDMLRDAFIAIDSDGDGHISKEQLQSVISELQGEVRAAVFQPYLSSIFQTADKDEDGLLSLPEFFGSFTEGVGILPQNVLLDCVSHVQIRVTNEELAVLQSTFSRIDKDEDGLISPAELAEVLDDMWRNNTEVDTTNSNNNSQSNNDVTAEETAIQIIQKIDRDGDGMLNLSEFVLSFQTDQQVFPLGLLENKPKGVLDSLNNEERLAFASALESTFQALGTPSSFYNEELVYNTLESALSGLGRWERDDVRAIIDAVFLTCPRDPIFDDTVCVAAIVDSFCTAEVTARLSEEAPKAVVPPVIKSDDKSNYILGVVFRYLDADFDGFLVFEDIYPLQRSSMFPSSEDGEHREECLAAFSRESSHPGGLLDHHQFVDVFILSTDGSGFGIPFDKIRLFANNTIPADLSPTTKRILSIALKGSIQQSEQRGDRPSIAIQDFREFVFGACEWCSQDEMGVPTPKEVLAVFEPIARQWSDETVFNPHVVAKAINVSIIGEVSSSSSKPKHVVDESSLLPPTTAATNSSTGVVVVSHQQQDARTSILPPVMLTPFEYAQLCDSLSQLGATRATTEEELQSALKDILVGEGKNSLSELEQWQRLGTLFARIVETSEWPQLAKLVVEISTNPSCLAIGVEIDPAGDVKALEVLESCGLDATALREIVRKLAALDDVRDGAIDLKEAALLVRQAVAQRHPSWSERQVQRVIKTIFNAGFLNETSRSLSFTRVILLLAAKYYVVPEKHVEPHAAALSRRLDQHDVAGICSVIECLDGIPTDNYRGVLRKALAQRAIVSDTASSLAIQSCAIDYLRTYCVTPLVLAERLRNNPAVLVFPLMKAQDCQEVCARKMSVLLPNTVNQRITRTLLLLDRRGDGLILKAQVVPALRDALLSMLQVTSDADVSTEGISVLTAESEGLRFCTNLGASDQPSPIPALPCVQCAEALEGWVSEVIRLIVLSQPEVALPHDYYSPGGIRGLGGRPGPATTGLQMSHFIDYLVRHIPGTLIPTGYLPTISCHFKTPISYGQEEVLTRTLKLILSDRGGVVTPDELLAILTTALDAPSRHNDIARLAEMLLQVGEGPLGSQYDLRYILPITTVDSSAVTLQLSKITSGRAAAQVSLQLTRLEKVRRVTLGFLRLDDNTKDNVLESDEIMKSLMDDIERLAGVVDVRLRRQMAKARFVELDTDVDGVLCFEEFLASFSQGPSVPLGVVRPALSTVELDIVLNRARPVVSAEAVAAITAAGALAIKGGASSDSSSPSRRYLCPRNISNVAVFDDELQTDFEKYDVNGNGYLEYNEFREAYSSMENYGIKPSESEVETVFLSVCRDRSRVTFEEFCILMLRRSKM